MPQYSKKILKRLLHKYNFDIGPFDELNRLYLYSKHELLEKVELHNIDLEKLQKNEFDEYIKDYIMNDQDGYQHYYYIMNEQEYYKYHGMPTELTTELNK